MLPFFVLLELSLHFFLYIFLFTFFIIIFTLYVYLCTPDVNVLCVFKV